MFYKKLDIAG